jgi:hypothetical protein
MASLLRHAAAGEDRSHAAPVLVDLLLLVPVLAQPLLALVRGDLLALTFASIRHVIVSSFAVYQYDVAGNAPDGSVRLGGIG